MTHCFIIYAPSDDDPARPPLSQGRPAAWTIHTWQPISPSFHRDPGLQDYLDPHLTAMGAETRAEFATWMAEHCPSPLIVLRKDPNGEWDDSVEVLITDPNQAFEFRLR